MTIRKQVIYDSFKRKNIGYIDIGGLTSNQQENLATETLVFKMISLSGNFKCAVGYFFVDKVASFLQAHLIKTCISNLCDVGIYVHTLTCDGTSSNIQTFKLLSCYFELGSKFKTTFKHIHSKYKICAILKKRFLLQKFIGCEATIQFIRVFDKLFDLFNSRNPYGKGFK